MTLFNFTVGTLSNAFHFTPTLEVYVRGIFSGKNVHNICNRQPFTYYACVSCGNLSNPVKLSALFRHILVSCYYNIVYCEWRFEAVDSRSGPHLSPHAVYINTLSINKCEYNFFFFYNFTNLGHKQ